MMKVFSPRILRMSICFLVVSTFVSIALAQDGKLTSFEKVPLKDQATSIPTSDNIITLKITLADGQLVQVSEQEGGMIRLETDGTVFGITPHIRDINNGLVSVEIFRITRISKAGTVGESIEILENFEADKVSLKFSNTSSPFSIQVKEIQKSTKEKKKAPSLTSIGIMSNPAGAGRCCVTCGNTTACGCAVVLSCGSCCSDGCC